ncbi:cell cycle histidine kinase CckA [Methylocella tundrae]|uniref:histidine kinase n=1 Tax=Methylocella tundrae TaxID=227605 RepID=A0A4U8YYL4_METTU|nr:response regulator [Methylocella tundrae]WPP06066.1 response regulator [Methylocella tundrae]VFU08666.1 Protein histidine kinase / Response regulator [Methylocella tundrae]
MTDQPIPAAFERTERAGSPALVLVFALFLAGAAALFSFLPKDEAGNVVMGLLAALAVVGVFAVFAFAVGLLQFAGQAAKNDITKLICDGNQEGLIATDAPGKIIYANETYMHLSGARNPADLRPVERLFSGAPDVSEAIYRLAQAARDGKPNVEELRLSPPLSGDGRVGWYKIKVRPLPFAGVRRANIWTVADVTRERERQENVFQELQHAIDFLDYAPAGFFSCDRDGAVSYMNATLAAWLDYDLAQVGSGGLALADFLAGDGASLIASIAGGAGEVRTEQFDLDLKRRGGQSLPVRLLHRVAFGSDGAAGPSRTLVLNRAPGEEPAEDLRAAEVRFARVFNSTPMAIAILDANGGIVRSNAAFARLMPEALKWADVGAGRSIYAGILERDRNALETALAAAAGSQTDIPPVDVALAGDGDRSARLFISASDERDGAGATIYALDTTEQRTLQNNFAQSQKMQAIGQLAGGVAHDFNNVLTAIIGYSDLLLANHRPTDPSFRDIMQIKQNANRAAGLVRQLLAFSRRQTLRPQVLQLGDVLSDLQMLMRRLVGEKINLELRHGRDLWLVRADLNQFEQVIVNLIVNARDAMPGGGDILLRTRNVMPDECASFDENSLLAGEYVAIEVEDGGHGVPPEVKDKIFEPFFTTKEVGKGTGLGLAMVYGIVKQTGGYVFCSSMSGKGATFTVLLPRYVAESHEAAPSVEPAKPAADLTGHGTILLVEDEEAVRAFGARALASRGYSVLQAASGLEALDIVEQNQGKIDLVVSDVVMPEMDGPTMFGELRKRGVKAKVIFVSGYAEEAFAKNLPEGEDFGFLPKPFSLKQLIEAVKAAAS